MKIALTIALSHDVKLLILDEATAGMDVSGREEVMELLEDFCRARWRHLNIIAYF